MDNQFYEAVELLAEKIGITVSEMYHVMVLGARTTAIFDIVCMIFIIIIWGLTAKVIKFFFFDKNEKREETEFYFLKGTVKTTVDCTIYEKLSHEYEASSKILIVITVILSFISVISIFFVPLLFNEIIQCILNPEYWALSEILSIFNV